MKINHVLIISHYACNFNCSYCNQREHANLEFLNIEDIIPFIDYLNIHNDDKNIHFQFEGGETLIRWKTFIRPLVNYIKFYTTLKPTYSLFTNCTIYTEELFHFLKENNIQVILSIDGDREVFESQRNNKWFDLVQTNAEKFLTLPNTRINAVFTPQTIQFLESSYNFFLKIGAK